MPTSDPRWSAQVIAQALGWAWAESPGEYQGLCPLHESSGTHKYNAGVKQAQDGVIFHCFASGCTYDAYKAYLKGVGLEPNQRTTTRQEVIRYAYQDASGHTVYWNIRYHPKDFRMAHPGANGDVFGVKGIPRVVYRLPDVLENVAVLFFCEGEKDVETLERLGLRATCIAGGANGWSPYVDRYAQQLAGQDLVLLPHNDEAGRRLMTEVLASMQTGAKRVRVVTLPGDKPGWDVTDWVQAGGTAEALWALVEGVSQAQVDTAIVEIAAIDLMAMHFPPIKWYAAGLLHEGMVLFGGKSKRGKSWIMMNLALSVATGGNVFGHYEVPRPVKVLYCALEDGPRRTQRRMAMIDKDADFSRIKFAFRMPPLENGGIDYIARHIKNGYEVVVVDVLAHVETAGKNGLRDYHEVYRTFAPLQALRSEYQFAMVMVTHLRKAESEEVFDNLHGSVAYQGAQDALWVMERKQGEDTALLHLRDKDAEDKIAELKFDGAGIWSFIGEGEDHAETTEESGIIKLLLEEAKPMGIKDIMLALGMHPGRYAAIRKRLQRMASKGFVIRTERGLYMALKHAGWDVPF